MASCLEQYQIKYQGRQYDQESGGRTTTMTYQGSFEALREASLNELAVGYIDETLGTIDSSSLQQGEGPFWELTVVYRLDSPDTDFDSEDDVASGDSDLPLHSELTVRMTSRDIEVHENYLRCWNYNLWCAWIGHPGKMPSFSNDFINAMTHNHDLKVPANMTFMVTEYNDVYFEYSVDQPEELVIQNIPYTWLIVYTMEKPGVNTYDFPVYEMTQYGKFDDKKKATKLVTNQIGKIVKPMKGDFGVNKKLKGNWLCEGADIRHNGKKWIGTITYLHSGNEKGWDTDIYSPAKENGPITKPYDEASLNKYAEGIINMNDGPIIIG